MADISATLIPLDDKLYKHFTAFTEAYAIGKKQYCYPKHAPKILQQYQTFEAYEDDVYVVAFPKTGTTWLQAIVYVLSIDLDFDRVKNTDLEDVFPYVGLSMLENAPVNSVENAIEAPRPRLLKFHTPLSHVPPDIWTKKCKIFYVYRNVKDTIISDYHFLRSMKGALYVGSLDEFADLFMENKVPGTPYIAHVKEMWEHRHEKNIFFTTYEEMTKDLEKVIGDIAQFLDKKFSKEEIRLVGEYCQFDNMKRNESLNKESYTKNGFFAQDFKFMRKGVVGSWKTEMSPELIARIDEWTFDNTEDCPELRNIL